MVKLNKMGQSGANAAILVIIITVLIVLYILFLPPADREALLANSSTSGSTSAATQILLRETPGVLDYRSDEEREYDFASFSVSTEVRGEVLSSRSSLYVKNSVFEKTSEAVQFSADTANSDNLLLSFNIDDAEGTLKITLNGNTILNSALTRGNSPPISIDSKMLEENNELVFSVSSPGVAFWRYNEYELSNLKVTADVKDVSQSENIQTLSLDSDDVKNLKTAQLRFAPVCRTNTRSLMTISVNGNLIFNGLPDCNVYSYKAIPENVLFEGENTISFKINEGSILIDRMRLTSTFEEEKYPVYYFEMEDGNFTNPDEPEDYILNSGYDAFIDMTFQNTNQKRYELFINGKKIGVNTAKTVETRQIDNYLRPGTNSVEIRPLQDMTMTEIKIRLKRV